ncbi:QVPTGV class sortase B protein-sorting domain-containing protein [Streptococcus pyogenes]|uniref:QVPTGV class sortase B protein-sorting domain-containing protein n=1 Tax=Streptococcus pyogenes TaxID=1314 RepID=UPI00109C951E|nr:QVPTGV class sortase B protein-sorting domain-containing protein [Streptococcus pyogenes]VHF42027.1 pilin [Streptococcus pyogenes]VHG72258.1 pilin [Streptococcus pyogenes]HEQ9666931.1 QVPTGV class sortase B protein-sorting domain-containing protein [Streptococcus pyogenes]
MKKNKLLLATAILATALGTASLNQNVKAKTAGVVTGKTLPITKSMIYTDNEILMPKTTFTFTIEPDTTASGKTKDGLEIKSGETTGLTTKAIVSYDNTDKESAKNKTSNFNFETVTFSGIGIYRYTVSEQNDGIEGIQYDGKKWTVDVYVGNKEGGGFEPKYVVSKEVNSDVKKPIRFENSFKTTSLKIEKKVTGNTGDHKKAFNFTLTLQPNEYYEASSVVKIEENGQTKDVKIGEAYKFTLNDSQSVILSKLPVGINYKVEEAEANQGGYTTTATLKDGEKLSTYNLGQEHKTDKTADEIVVTNKRDTQVPTGVVGTLAPFAVLSIVAIGGVIYITKRKKA